MSLETTSSTYLSSESPTEIVKRDAETGVNIVGGDEPDGCAPRTAMSMVVKALLGSRSKIWSGSISVFRFLREVVLSLSFCHDPIVSRFEETLEFCSTLSLALFDSELDA